MIYCFVVGVGLLFLTWPLTKQQQSPVTGGFISITCWNSLEEVRLTTSPLVSNTDAKKKKKNIETMNFSLPNIEKQTVLST